MSSYGKRRSGKEIISYKEGWGKANSKIQNFLETIENMDSEKMTGKPPTFSQNDFTEVYHQIFEMCNQKEPYNLSQPLYNAFNQTLIDYFKQRCIPDLEKAHKLGGAKMLKAWAWRWWVASRVIEQMVRNFRFLDRYYIKSQEELRPLKEQGFFLYNQTVYSRFKDALPEVMLNLVDREREGEDIDRELMRNTIDSFVTMGQHLEYKDQSEKNTLAIYVSLFERQFLERSRLWYQQMSQKWKEESTPAYLKIADRQETLEQDRLIAYIHKSTNVKLQDVVRTELLMTHQSELLDKNTGLRKMFERANGVEKKSACEDLERLYTLYSLRGDEGLEPISKRMMSHIAEEGDKYVATAKAAESTKGGGGNHQKQLIVDLLALHSLFHSIVINQFRGYHLCVKALKNGFKTFINREEYVATRLAMYSHQCLKRGRAAGSEYDMTELMENIVKLYDYINDKDFFELHYQRFLAERLINDTSESYDNEKTMIAKLKLVGGNATWSKKLEEMFKDLRASQNFMNEFRSSHPEKNDLDFDCRVQTYGQWPSSVFDKIAMPAEVAEVTDAFAKFYAEKFSGRCLEYRMDLGKAQVMVPLLLKGKKPNRKDFVVSPLQMKILLAFNKKHIWEYNDLAKYTEIKNTDEQFDRALLSLVHPTKCGLLKKKPNSKDCKPGNQFRINNGFKSNMRRVEVPPYAGSLKRKNKQNEEERRAINKLREHQADASIVRTMKARKELEHTDLQTEVIRQLASHFPAKPQFIKKRIATLIDQEYIKRDPDRRTVYKYIA